jgi:putative flippase GtrA
MPRWLIVLAIVTLYVLHQDWWFRDSARPLVFGFLPVGLFYHAVFSVVAALLMVLLVQYAWPTKLEQQVEQPSVPRDPHGPREGR